MKIKIKVTKDILRRSMLCGGNSSKYIEQNCAIALAVRDIFPEARVSRHYLKTHAMEIYLPINAIHFISLFDELEDEPDKRIELPEFEFEVELPDDLVEPINIDDIHKSPTLEVVAV